MYIDDTACILSKQKVQVPVLYLHADDLLQLQMKKHEALGLKCKFFRFLQCRTHFAVFGFS